jgi:hypothetical protein
MYDVKADLIQALRSTCVALPALLPIVLAKTARIPSADPGRWSAVEVVCHLRDSEETALQRTRMMRDQADPRIAGYDQAALALQRDYAASQADHALSAFLAFRRQHTDELDRLNLAEWNRPGEHSEYGRITILEHAQHLVTHDLIHLAQLAAI